jgi:hypothetical protein
MSHGTFVAVSHITVDNIPLLQASKPLGSLIAVSLCPFCCQSCISPKIRTQYNRKRFSFFYVSNHCHLRTCPKAAHMLFALALPESLGNCRDKSLGQLRCKRHDLNEQARSITREAA